MAVWGAPVAQEDDAERAVRAALELVAAVPELDPLLERPRGRAHRRSRGHARRRRARHGRRRPGQHRFARPVRSRAGDGARRASHDDALRRQRSRTSDAGEHELKGKASRSALARAPSRRGAEGRGPRRPVSRRPSSAAIASSASSRSSSTRPPTRAVRTCLSIVGVAGMGKSRLAWEFEKYIDGLLETALVAPGPLPRVRRRGRVLGAGRDGAHARADRRGRIRRASRCAKLPGVARRDRRRSGGARVRGATAPAPARARGARRSRGPRGSLLRVAALLRADGRAEPGDLVFEDIHWADAALVEFVEYLLDWSRGHRDLRRDARAPRGRPSDTRAGARTSATSPRSRSSRCQTRRSTASCAASCPGSPTRRSRASASARTGSRSMPSRPSGCCSTAGCSSAPRPGTRSPATSRRSTCPRRCTR